MGFIILVISFSLLSASFAFTPSGRDNEVAEAILDVIETPREFSLRAYKLTPEEEQILQGFSDAELSRGFATLLFNEDKDPIRGNRASTGSLIVGAISNNKDLISDQSEIIELLYDEKESRGFFLMFCLASSFSKNNGRELIPIFFNTLFRDGRVTKEEGEYTRSYADDVSKFAYSIIVSRLKKMDSGYNPLDPYESGVIPHEEKVDHLANWLISNWPGCESFTLTDQNVPAMITSIRKKKILRQPSSQNEESTAPTKEVFKFSWRIIAAIALLIGSLLYWGKKRFAY